MKLFAPLTLTTRTLARTARGGADLVVHVTKGIAGRVTPSGPQAPRRDADTRPQRSQPSAKPSAPPTSARSGSAAAPAAAPAPAAPAPAAPEPAATGPATPPEAAAPDQPEFAPLHMDEEEAEVVYSSADAGAEDGAGPTIRVDEPWDGYRGMAAADVIDRLAVADAAMLAAVQLYETSHKQRPSILKAVDLRQEAAARA